MSSIRNSTIAEIVLELVPHGIVLRNIEVIRASEELALDLEKDGHRRVVSVYGSLALPTCVAQCAELFAQKGSS